MVWSCSSLTEVDAVDIVEESDLESATGAAALRAGAMSGFAGIFLSGGTSQITASGRISDELFGNARSDQRSLPEPEVEIQYAYEAMHATRVNLSRAIRAMETYLPSPAAKIGELFALRSYTEIFFGENVCSGIPLGDIVDGTAVPGEPLDTQEMFQRAVEDADAALTRAADSARILNLARVARGRALLNMGRFNDAAAAVAQVPTTYRYQVAPASANQTNSIAALTASRSMSVSNNEGVNGLNFRTAADPRVPTQAIGACPGTPSGCLLGTTPAQGITAFRFTTYTATNTPVVLASGIEARLIEAEAALQAGNAATWLTALNTLRTTCTVAATCPTPAPAGTGGVTGLPPLADPGTTAGRVDLMFRERAFWMFGTGHRHGDLRRLIRPTADGGYGRASSSTNPAGPETVFPTGTYYTGTAYGNSVTFPADARQFNNPAYPGCQSRAP
ncbi:MAG: hypothetical protein ACREON_17865 [Gemmatimonadaceae bacterium]